MPYDFDLDLSRLPRQFFGELSRVAEEKQLHRRFGLTARELAERFRLSEATGLDVQTQTLPHGGPRRRPDNEPQSQEEVRGFQ